MADYEQNINYDSAKFPVSIEFDQTRHLEIKKLKY